MITSFGHSTLTPEAALAALDMAGVDVLIDVRSHPTSRFVQWRRELLARWIKRESGGQIEYQWWPELGGWDVRHAQDEALRGAMLARDVDLAAYSGGAFPKQRIAAKVPPSEDGSPTWINRGLLDYAWYTTLPEYQAGLTRLIDMFGAPADAGGRDDSKPTAAIMCAECVWWRCHRSMIADTLVYRGVDCWHIQPRWTRHLDALGNRLERYPAEVRTAWTASPSTTSLGVTR